MRSMGVMKVLCRRATTPWVMWSHSLSMAFMRGLTAAQSLPLSAMSRKARQPSTVFAACFSKSSKKDSSRGSRRMFWRCIAEPGRAVNLVSLARGDRIAARTLSGFPYMMDHRPPVFHSALANETRKPASQGHVVALPRYRVQLDAAVAAGAPTRSLPRPIRSAPFEPCRPTSSSTSCTSWVSRKPLRSWSTARLSRCKVRWTSPSGTATRSPANAPTSG